MLPVSLCKVELTSPFCQGALLLPVGRHCNSSCSGVFRSSRVWALLLWAKWWGGSGETREWESRLPPGRQRAPCVAGKAAFEEGPAEGQEPPRRHWRADSDRANRCILEPQQPSHVVPGAPAPPTPRRPEWVSPPTAKPDSSCWLCLVVRGDCCLPAAILRASALTQPDQRTHAPPLCLAGGSSLRVHPGAERGPDWGGRVEKGGAGTSGGRGDPGDHCLCLCLVAALRCVCGLWGPPVFPWTCRESPRTQGSPEVSAASARLPTSICALANPASPTRKIPRSSAVQTLWGKMRHPVS